MKTDLNVNFRTGYRLEMHTILDSLQTKYVAMLNATVDTYELYDEVSNETDNDLSIIKAELGVLMLTGYINEDELDAMVKRAEEIRLNILKNLEEKDGTNE